MADNLPLKAGSIKVESLVLIKAGEEYDLNTYLIELSIFEDVFSNTLSGTAVISDSNNLVGALPIIGGEILTAKLSVPGFENNTIHRSFYVYAVRDRNPSSTDRQQTYMLCFASLEAAVDNVTYISRKYTGQTDEIAKKIFDEYLAMPRVWDKTYPMPAGLSTDASMAIPAWKKEIPQQMLNKLDTGSESPVSKNKVTWVVPLWTPFKALNWLANRHIEEDSKSPSTLCWESSQGFYFSSIDKLFKAQSDVKARKQYFYGLDDAAIEAIRKASKDNTQNILPKGYDKVETVLIPKGTDVFQSQEHGHYSSNMHILDVVTKKYEEYIFDYASNFSDFQHLHGNESSPSPTFPTQQIRNIYSYRTFRPKHKYVFNDYQDPKFEDWVLQRTSILYDLSNIKVEITVPGYCQTEAGEVVQFYYPRLGPKSEKLELEDLVDPYYTGSYLVTAVRHIITQDKYYMRLELVKESFATSLG